MASSDKWNINELLNLAKLQQNYVGELRQNTTRGQTRVAPGARTSHARRALGRVHPVASVAFTHTFLTDYRRRIRVISPTHFPNVNPSPSSFGITFVVYFVTLLIDHVSKKRRVRRGDETAILFTSKH